MSCHLLPEKHCVEWNAFRKTLLQRENMNNQPKAMSHGSLFYEMSSGLSKNIRHADRDTREVFYYFLERWFQSWIHHPKTIPAWSTCQVEFLSGGDWKSEHPERIWNKFLPNNMLMVMPFFGGFFVCVSIYECSPVVLLYFFLPLPWTQQIKSCSLHQAKKVWYEQRRKITFQELQLSSPQSSPILKSLVLLNPLIQA